MVSIKVVFIASRTVCDAGNIHYRLTLDRHMRHIDAGITVAGSQWSLAALDSDTRLRVKCDIERLQRIIDRFETELPGFSIDDIVAEFHRYAADFSMKSYMSMLSARLRADGRIRTSETYRAALRSFSAFMDGEDIMIDCIRSGIMEAYQVWLKSRGLVLNTISFYMRILRAVYNRAVECGATIDHRPFRHVYTGIGRTVKRALPLAAIRRLRELDLHGEPHLAYARDMFILSFYTRGMSFIDMAFLLKENLSGGHITYRRRKTGQTLSIAWTREMQQIIDRYPVPESPYLFPIIRHNSRNPRAAYINAAYNINHSLKQLAPRIGAKIPLTLYVARHSWASAAQSKGVPIGIISEGMGHHYEATTRIYLASIATSVVDRANAMIMRSI